MSEPAERSFAWKAGMEVSKIVGALCLLFVVSIVSFLVWTAYPPYLFSDIMTAPDECELVYHSRSWGDGWNQGSSDDYYACELSEGEIEVYLTEYVEEHGGIFNKHNDGEPGADNYFLYLPERNSAHTALFPEQYELSEYFG